MSTSKASTSAESLDLVDTDYSACSVSACPNDRSLVACGLYQVVKDETAPSNEESPVTKRLGRCLFSRLDRKGKFRELQRVEAAAILDIAWSYQPGVNRLAYADSIGQLCFYDLANDMLSHYQTVQLGDPGVLCLSLDWDNRLSGSEGSLVVSLSDGSISILSPATSYEVSESWRAHDYEPWIAAWDYWDTSCIWTGGDDLKLKVWDMRQGTGSPKVLNKSFNAGVTTIQSSPHQEHIFAVGSYDAHVRIFDKRHIKQPLVDHDVGGGVWRVRWHPTDASKLLTACMHDGFKTLHINTTEATCRTITRFDEHGKDALAYGVDWATPAQDNTGDLVASCSFYDHQLRSWVAC